MSDESPTAPTKCDSNPAYGVLDVELPDNTKPVNDSLVSRNVAYGERPVHNGDSGETPSDQEHQLPRVDMLLVNNAAVASTGAEYTYIDQHRPASDSNPIYQTVSR